MRNSAPGLSLDGNLWEFQGVPLGTHRPGPAAWQTARVPGNVHLDLMNLGQLADPHIGMNEADLAWVERKDWWYRRSFKLASDLLACARVHLKFEGLDTFATIWLNGEAVGLAQNSLVEHEWEVRRLLKPGENELLVRLASPVKAAENLARQFGDVPGVGDSLRNWVRKAAYSWGWDWGPRIVTSGIFKSVTLEGQSQRRWTDLHLQIKSVSQVQASGFIEAEIDSIQAGPCTVNFELGPFKATRKIKLKAGLSRIRVPFKINRPKLWWPRHYGDPNLYNLVAALDSGESASCAVGLRQVALERKKDSEGESFVLHVNGKPVFCAGANWIPSDTLMGRLSKARLEKVLSTAFDSNMNMLRVWGGGYYESEDFYAWCDRHGIMVWQDFPFGCNEVPETPWYAREVDSEARKAVVRLRRHASLALWCGNNENHQARYDHWFGKRERKDWGALYYHKILPKACRELDPGTPYWPGSPFGGKNPNDPSQGDRHNWTVWANLSDYFAYRQDKGRFMSEFGFASLPGRRTLEKAVPEAERYLHSRTLEAHDKVGSGGAYARIAYFMANHLPMGSGLEDFRYLSQVNQAEALVTGIEHWRRRQFLTSGTLFWQLQDCWPVTSWAVVDSELEPKLAWYRIRGVYEPVLLSAWEDLGVPRNDRTGFLPKRGGAIGGSCEIWVTSTGTQSVLGHLNIELWDEKGCLNRLESKKIKLAANQSAKVWSRHRFELGLIDPARQYLVATLTWAKQLRRIPLYFERPTRQSFSDPGLSLKVSQKAGVWGVSIKARRLARYVELQANLAGTFSDNGFDLLPGESRWIEFKSAQAARLSRPRIKARSLYEAARKRA